MIALLATQVGWGHDLDEIQSVRELNALGVLVNWSAPGGREYDGAYGVRPTATVFFQTSGRIRTSYDYRMRFSLVDDRGVEVPILDERGLPGTAFLVMDTITLPGPVGEAQTVRTYAPPKLVPSGVQLDPAGRYSLRLSLEKRPTGAGAYVSTGDEQVSVAKQYLHFPGLITPDPAFNVLATLDDAAWARTYLVNTVPGKNTFRVAADLTLVRFDDPLLAVKSDDVTVHLGLELRDAATDVVVPLAVSQVSLVVPMQSYVSTANPNLNHPFFLNFSPMLNLAPSGGTQLDSVNNTYRLTVSISHVDLLGQPPVPGNSLTLAPERLLHFNGHLLFGAIDTTFSSLANDPGVITVIPDGVRSSLQVNNQSGVIEGQPNHTYGDDTVLPVVLRANGNAEYSSSTPVVVAGPVPDVDQAGCIQFTRTNLSLNSAGATADLKVKLPTGFGVRYDQNARLLDGTMSFAEVPLGAALAPLGNPGYSGLVYACEETKPFWIQASNLRWLVSESRFTLVPQGLRYVRASELASLEAAPVPASHRTKFSNEQYFRYIDQATSAEVSISTDAECNARMTLSLAFEPGQFTAHFPYGAKLSWTGAGAMDIEDDRVVPGGSLLTQAASVTLPYSTDCFEPDCLPDHGVVARTLIPEAGELYFTVDGGLHASGATPGAELNWGYIGSLDRFAHRTEAFAEGAFLMSGCFLRGSDAPANLPHGPFKDGPGVMLYTGVVPEDLAQVERPDTPAYHTHDVAGDYAGLNFEVGINPVQAESTLAAKPTGLYGLRSRSKYYARFAGVSGVHEAVPGTFLANPELYGYDFTLHNFSLSFLGSQNEESRTEGSIDLPWPADFIQDFEQLKFLCNGALDQAEVPPDQGSLKKLLAYWNSDFITEGIHFETCAGGECDPSEGFLVLGLEAFASSLETQLFGEVGFLNTGNIITPALASACGLPVRSRLQTDNNVPMVGAGKTYNLVPVTEAYYNNFDYIPASEQSQAQLGFLSLAAKQDVTFFADLRVQVHTGGKSGGGGMAPYLMGGWSQPGKGWEVGGDHFFNDPDFDPDHRTFDPAVSAVSQYRREVDPGTDDKYLARAEKQWLGVVDLDYPVYWNPTLRYFQSQSWNSPKNQALMRDLLILHTSTEITFLDHAQADLRFGAQYEGVPVVDIASLAITELTGDLFDGALLLNLTAINEGLAELNELLNEDMHDFFAGPFDALLTPTVNHLYDALLSSYQPVQKTFSPPAGSTIHEHCLTNANYQNSFQQKLEDLLGSIQDPASTVAEVYAALEKVATGLEKAGEILAKQNGKRQSIAELVGKSAPDFVQDQAAGFDAAIEKAEPALDSLELILANLKTNVEFLRNALQGTAEWAEELSDAMNQLKSSGAFHQMALGIEADINQMIGNLNLAIDNPNQVLDPVLTKKKIRQMVEDRFFGSAVPTAILKSFKHRLYDTDLAMRQGLNSLFGVGNTIIRNLVAAVLAQVGNEYSPALGKVSTAMQTARVNGSASIKGDSLKHLRLDASVQLELGATLGFDAYLEISELDSSGSDLDAPCEPSNVASWTEVTMGADNVQLGWISPDLLVNVGTKFSFTDNPDFEIINMMGAFSVAGALKFETFEIKEVGFAIAMGEIESHLAAKVRAEFNKKELAAGFFVGKTCTEVPLKLVNKDFAKALGNDYPFTGFYAYGEAWYPINELIGIPSSCLFNLRGGVGMGVFVDVTGPVFGGQIHYGLSGELLCIFEVQGEIDLVGIKKGHDYTFHGTGTVTAEVGVCPFCVDVSKSISLTVWVHLEPTPDGIGSTTVDYDYSL